jgi:hypothetical protein
VVCYVILGAAIFMEIESGYEKENHEKIEKNREDFYKNVKITAESLFNDYLKENFHKKYNEYRNEEMRIKENIHNKEIIKRSAWFIELDKEKFTHKLTEHLAHLLMENKKIEDKDKSNMLDREEIWNFPNAILYSVTVITTIGKICFFNSINTYFYVKYLSTLNLGYGNITPKSNTGKLLTIFYAMIGIPLFFICLTNTGDLLAEVFIYCYSKCVRFIFRRLFKHKLKMPYSASKFQENKQEMVNIFK